MTNVLFSALIQIAHLFVADALDIAGGCVRDLSFSFAKGGRQRETGSVTPPPVVRLLPSQYPAGSLRHHARLVSTPIGCPSDIPAPNWWNGQAK
jgi:hypothetical protein